jgi:hypothetical protein
MGARRIWGRGGFGLITALTCGAMLAGGSPALAALHRGDVAPQSAGDITTVAGGAGGPAKATTVSIDACGVSFAGGHLYIPSEEAVREVNPATDWLTTPAGSGVSGPFAEGGPAAAATMNTCGAAVDHQGNLLIADVLNERIRVVPASTGEFYGQVMKARHIYTVAGDGTLGFSGDGGPATSAELNSPEAVAVDAAGNLVIADAGNARIRVVAEGTGTFYGQAMTAGDIYTVAGDGRTGYTGDGGPATGAEFSYPSDVLQDGAGNLVIPDTGNNVIRVVAEGTGTFYGQAMTAGDIYTVAGDGQAGYSGDGGPALSALLRSPGGVAVDGSANLVIADTLNNRVRVVAESTGSFYGQAMTAGDIYTVAGGHRGFSGDGGPARGARLDGPTKVAVDGSGNLVVADSGNHRIRAVAATAGTFYRQRMRARHIYTVAGTGTGFDGYSGDGGPATSAELSVPEGVAVDGSGNLVIADTNNNRVRVAAKTTGTFYGVPMTAGNIYTVAGNGLGRYAGDGGPGTSAELNSPDQATVDGAGNLLIADTTNDAVRVIAGHTGTFYGQAMTAGDIYTVAGTGQMGYNGDGRPATSAELNQPETVLPDGAGNLVITDANNQRVRVIAEHTGTFYGQAMTAGDIYTVAGTGQAGFSGDRGPAVKARVFEPYGVALDAAGNLVLTDNQNWRVRVIAEHTGTFYGQAMTAGDIYTVAGDGVFGYSGDGGPATHAALDHPASVAVDGSGNLVFADAGNSRIRVVAATTGTFYGVAMTAGDIYTVAGDKTAGYNGDGQAARTDLAQPFGVALDGAGSLVIADTGNCRIRVLTG